jgi:predicted thioesterase
VPRWRSLKVEPRSVSFSVTVLDDEDVISVGTHTALSSSRRRFDQKVSEKAPGLGTSWLRCIASSTN